jgi:hypothetical protein
MGQIVTARQLAGDDFFFPLIIGNGEGDLHRLVR